MSSGRTDSNGAWYSLRMNAQPNFLSVDWAMRSCPDALTFYTAGSYGQTPTSNCYATGLQYQFVPAATASTVLAANLPSAALAVSAEKLWYCNNAALPSPTWAQLPSPLAVSTATGSGYPYMVQVSMQSGANGPALGVGLNKEVFYCTNISTGNFARINGIVASTTPPTLSSTTGTMACVSMNT